MVRIWRTRARFLTSVTSTSTTALCPMLLRATRSSSTAAEWTKATWPPSKPPRTKESRQSHQDVMSTPQCLRWHATPLAAARTTPAYPWASPPCATIPAPANPPVSAASGAVLATRTRSDPCVVSASSMRKKLVARSIRWR